MIGTEPAWCQRYRYELVGIWNLSPLRVGSGRSQVAGTGPAPLVVGPLEM